MNSNLTNLNINKLNNYEQTLNENTVRKWLQQHPQFCFEYFVENATRFMVDQWILRKNSLISDYSQFKYNQNQKKLLHHNYIQNFNNFSHKTNLSHKKNLHLFRSNSCTSVTSLTNKNSNNLSCSMRKISNHEFEKSSLSLGSNFTTTYNGKPSFLPVEENNKNLALCKKKQKKLYSFNTNFNLNLPTNKDNLNSIPLSVSLNHTFKNSSYLNNSHTDFKIDDKINQVLINKTPYKVNLMLDLVKDICNDLKIKSLCHKILQNISLLIKADRCSLFLVKENATEKYFISTLFDVRCDSNLNDQNLSIRVPWNTGILGYVANQRKCVNIENCYIDQHFHSQIDNITGYVTQSMLCAPIIDQENKVIGVAQAINKKLPNSSNFTSFLKKDKEIFKNFLKFCSIGLKNSQLYEQKNLEIRRNQVLVDLATMVFEQQTTIEHIVYKVMLHTQSLLQVQRCQVFLLEDYNNNDLNWYNMLHQYDEIEKINNNSNNININCNINNICENNNSKYYNNQSNILKPQFTRIFDLETINNYPIKCRKCKSQETIQNQQSMSDFKIKFTTNSIYDKIPSNFDITINVARTGQTVNIFDCEKNEKFDTKLNELINEEKILKKLNTTCLDCIQLNKFCFKQILCIPIRNGQRKIIGVSQLINKLNNTKFTKNDETLFEAFAIFIGMGIQNTLNYENCIKVNAKHQATLQSLSYHCSASDKSAQKLTSKQLPILQFLIINQFEILKPYNINTLNWKNWKNWENSFNYNHNLFLNQKKKKQKSTIIDLNGKIRKNFFIQHSNQLICYLPLIYVDNDFFKSEQSLLVSIQFFENLNLINKFKINYKTLCRWLLSVQKNYRNVCYHNWRHAFEVAEMMFIILTTTKLLNYLDEYEIFALLIACFCHDLDHRGTNNMFELKCSSPLAHLYSSSTMEHHHFDQTLLVLSSPGNQILANLSTHEFKHVVELIKHAILATDLAFYFQNKKKFKDQITNLDQAFSSLDNKKIFLSMLMTLCDLNAISKPWCIQKYISNKVIQEFFKQGDIERKMFNIKPTDMFNREKIADLPKMQIEFINSICQPIFEQFYQIFDECFVYRNFLLINKLNWIRTAAKKDHLTQWANQQLNNFYQELEILKISIDKIEHEASLQFEYAISSCDV